MKLADDHWIFEACKLTQEIAHTFLQPLNLNYFHFCRIYANGTILPFVNNTEWVKFYLDYEGPFPSSLKREHSHKQSYFFVWEGNLQEELLYLAKQHADITQGISLIRRYKNYYDMIGYAAPSHHKQAIDCYLNNLNHLVEFVDFFQESIRDFIKKFEKDPLVLPAHMQDPLKDKLLWVPEFTVDQNHKQPFIILQDNAKSHITYQEKRVVDLLLQGYTQKHTARELNISVRTVETYLQRMKNRLECSTTRELLHLVRAQYR